MKQSGLTNDLIYLVDKQEKGNTTHPIGLTQLPDSESRSTSYTLSTSAIESIIQKLKSNQHRSSTQAIYHCVWKTFNQFYIKLDVKPDNWEDRLNLFVAYLVNCNKKSTTIKSYISAIKAVLAADDVILCENRVLLTAMTQACKLENDSVRTKLPIRRGLLTLLIKSVPKLYQTPQPYLVTLYQAMLITAYYGMFHIGELTQSSHVVKACDVHIGLNKKKLLFVLRSSKTHNKGTKPQTVKISGLNNGENVSYKYVAANHELCPFKLLSNYLTARKKRKNDNEQFFVFKDRSPVMALHYRKVLKELIVMNSLNNSLYTAHGTRSGRAHDLLEMKIPIPVIKKLGRWSSNIIYTYLS